MGDDLKLCPFCASPALALHAMHSVICSSRSETTCAAIYYDPKEWQQRPIEDALRSRAEAAEQRAEAAEAGRAASELRLREVGQILIAEIGAAGPTFTEDVARAAVARIQAAEAELAQARADARVLAGLLHFDAAPSLAEISVDALTNAISAAASLPDTEVLAVIRRALGGAA